MKLTASLVFAATLAALSVSAQDYEIRLSRPEHKGDKVNLIVNGKEFQEMSMTSGGAVLRNQKKEFTVALKSVVTILEVNNSGRPKKESHLISELSIVENGKKTDLLTNGVVVVASADGQRKQFEVNGMPASLELQQVLDVVIEVANTEVTDDDLFGTKQRKKVGESWDINKELMMGEMAKGMEGKVTLKEAQGKATLKAVVNEPTGPVAVITFQLTAKAETPMPPGFVVKESAMTMSGSGKFPKDLAMGRPDESQEMTYNFSASGQPDPASPEAEIKMAMKRSTSTKRTPVK